MSEYLPTESASVVIGVCGEQASGKTVFSTCIFQSVRRQIPANLLLEFDRKEIGNANYFQTVENRLIKDGTTGGTLEKSVFPVRLFLKPKKPLTGSTPTVLSVDLLDFAGGHFTHLADLKDLKEPTDSDSEDVKALRTVSQTLERADAFIVLINSKEIDPINEGPSRNPFSPSVEFILSHCQATGKPVALLFSQVDRTPLMTESRFRALPRIRDFERDFTSDLDEATRGGRPFGLAKRISCYETIEGDIRPRHQTGDGSIWRPEPSEVVLTLLRATIPRVDAVLASVRAAAKAKKEEEDRLTREARNRWRAIAVAALVLVVLILAFSAWARHREAERSDVGFLRKMQEQARDEIGTISPADDARLTQIVATSRANGENGPAAVRDGIHGVQAAVAETARRLDDGPLLDRRYAEAISRVQTLLPLLGATALPQLEARNTFLSGWFGTERKDRRSRTVLLDSSAQQFLKAGDSRFSAVLAAQSTREKESEIATWEAKIDADSDVPQRLATMQNLLASSQTDDDPEFVQLARNRLASALGTTILTRHENTFVREKLLKEVAPDLARFSDGEVRFEVLAQNALACATREECANRRQILDSVNTEGETVATSWSSGVDNLLRSLLLDLPVDQRRVIWGNLAAALQSSYLFSSRSDAWPVDVMPLHAWIRMRINGGPDPTLELIERIARQPIYAAEIHYLRDHLAATEAERKVVSIYTNILAAAAQNSIPLPVADLAAIGEEVSSVRGGRPDAGVPLVQMNDEIQQVLTLVRSVNDWAASRTRSRLLTAPDVPRLERLLRDARKGHCTALATHEPPAECANAA